MEGRIRARLTKSEGRKFAFPVGAAFLVLAGILWWRERLLFAQILSGLGGVLLVAGAVIPTRLGPVYRAWMGLAHAISKVTTPIFMGIVYYLVISPIAVVMRAVGKNPLVRAPAEDGYWQKRPPGKRRGDLRRQF